MIAPLEYLTGNGLIRYPFKDQSSLKTNTNDILADTCILDLQLVSAHDTAIGAYLYSLTKTSTELNWVFKLYDQAGTDVATLVYSNLISAMVVREVLACNVNGHTLKVVPGIGLIALAATTFTYTFTKAATDIQASCFIAKRPLVTSVNFFNWANTSVKNYTGTQAVLLAQGTNLSFKQATDGIGMKVIPKAGQGLYNGCDDGTTGLVVKKINNIAPNLRNNFSFTTGDCVGSTSLPAEIKFRHTCDPKCTEAHVNAYAYYLNRIKDALSTVATYANGIKQDLTQSLTLYKEKNKHLSGKQVPYIIAEHATTSTATTKYISVIAGIFDPRKTNLIATLYVSFPTELKYIAGTGKLHLENTVYPLPSLVSDTAVFENKSISCKTGAILEFVTYTVLANIDKPVDLRLKHPEGSAFQSLNGNSSKPYFTIRYTNFKKDGVYQIVVVIKMFDLQQRTLSTGLAVTLPAGVTYVGGSGNLNLNNTVTNIVGSTLSGTSINFKHKASFTFRAIKTGNGEGTFNIAMTAGAYNFTRTALIKFEA